MQALEVQMIEHSYGGVLCCGQDLVTSLQQAGCPVRLAISFSSPRFAPIVLTNTHIEKQIKLPTHVLFVYFSDHVLFWFLIIPRVILFTFQTLVLFVYFPDHNPDRFAQDCSAPSSGSSSPEDRPLFRIWRCRPSTTHGHFRSYCSLARLHLVIFKLYYLIWGWFHKLFCALRQSIAPCTELLHHFC